MGRLPLRTSNDCAYQSRTLQIDGISLRPSGSSLSSCTRCARRMGSSSERNCDARKRVPVDGFSPNWTICRKETPRHGLDDAYCQMYNGTYRSQGNCCNATRGLATASRMHCTTALRTLMVSISLSVRFHDMMPIAQGRMACIAAQLPECCWCSRRRARWRPAYDARKLDGLEAEVTIAQAMLEQFVMEQQNDGQFIERLVSCGGDLTTDVWRTECSAIMTPVL
jgi:hypothetical protein